MSSTSSERVPAYLLILLGLVVLFAFVQVGEHYYQDFLLDLGRHHEPAPLFLAFVSLWMVLGLAAAACLTAGITSLLAHRDTPGGWLERGRDLPWLLIGTILAFAIPALIRFAVLKGAPLTDDETCYRFSAELLANFQLTTESPPHKLFFDHVFMINDGRMYSQYFLGWPALMAPGIWLGIEGYMNAIYCALTLPPLYWIAKRLSGTVAARLALLIFITSPMLMIGASTMMSHTSCLFALTWTVWMAIRSQDEDSRWWHASLVAVFFSLAFFNRPLTAVAIGTPLLVLWLRTTWRSGARNQRLIAFLAPAGVFGALFLVVNHVQNGSPLRISYAAAIDYAQSNQWRFTHWTEKSRMSVGFLDTSLYSRGLAENGLALFRLNASSFGWPASLIFLPLAWRHKEARPLWWMLLLFVLLHLTIATAGIDSFGPVHYFELALPLILLTVLGALRVSRFLATMPSQLARYQRAPITAVCVMILLSLTAFSPRRIGAVGDMAERTNAVLRAPEQANLSNAIVFVHMGLNRCHRGTTRGFVFQRPNNDIHHKNSVLWANHLSVSKDKLLMEAYPERAGYILWWQGKECAPLFIPLDEIVDGQIEPGVPPSYDLSDA
jgi:hypothetical protein